MNYDEQQGVAYAVGKLYDLLDEHASDEKIPKDAIRDLVKELDSFGGYSVIPLSAIETIEY